MTAPTPAMPTWDGAVDASVDVVVVGGNSSGMIHGGARYLQDNPSVTESSCRDSGYIQRIAPHLLFRIPFVMPIRAGVKGRIYLELIDAFFRAYDDYQPLKRGELHTRLDAADLTRLEPGLVGPFAGGVTFDEWGVDGARLCVINALDAKERGAKVFVHTTVEEIVRAPGPSKTYVVVARDMTTQAVTRVAAKLVVNATGAWAPITTALGHLPNHRTRVRPGKGIHVMLDRRITNFGILTDAIDGRQIFVEPWQNMSVLGTTDDDYYGDLDDVVATSEEVRYLVQGIARVFPPIREARAIGTWAGVRPTLYEYGKLEDNLSREHAIVDHAPDGAPGVYSMIGGKLASYRVFSEETSDRVAADLGVRVGCTTHERPLPGGEKVVDALVVATDHELAPVASRRLVYRHGTRALRVLERCAREPRERAVVCACEPVIEAEVRYAVANEMAQTIDDVARRTRLGLGACGGMRCAARCGQIIADELELPPKEAIRQARTFLERQARTRVAAMGPDQARQEALALAHARASLGVEDES